MKKALIIILAMAMALSFTACGDNREENSPSDIPSENKTVSENSEEKKTDEEVKPVYESPEKPYEIGLNGKNLSYFDTKEKAEEIFGDKASFFDLSEPVHRQSTENPININVDENGKIRSIAINSSDFLTYKGIAVGDDKSKVLDSFDYEADRLFCQVAFFGEEEADQSAGLQNEYVLIKYMFDQKDENKISQILIQDVTYAKTLK